VIDKWEANPFQNCLPQSGVLAQEGDFAKDSLRESHPMEAEKHIGDVIVPTKFIKISRAAAFLADYRSRAYTRGDRRRDRRRNRSE